MKRRRLLKKIVAGAALVAASAAPYAASPLLAPGQTAKNRNYLRPPGALADDAAFVAACIGCGLCGEVCPPRCLFFHSRGGGAKVNTPFLDAAEKGCILCGKCMEVCPTEALSVVPRERVAMGLAQIDRDACYPWVDRGVCGACVSICPLGKQAISHKMWNQYRPVIKDGCVGCGLCVEVCPHPSLPIWVVDRTEEATRKKRA
ncbi:MAG: 4Fe-4S dicluster domain-containing protein [Alphaproteobacteria bacterium]|nr:4Fe-4S dicluster domain-containing protein [Alphaproteobacteria bacterium]